ncbi:MAG: 4'-phosphopantetheinyl transferase family protein [Isosphaeraceae bacterium]
MIAGRPSLLEWQSGAEVPALSPDEVRAWIVDLDGAMAPGDDPDTTEPGPELAILSDDERARAARFVRARERRRFVRCRAALREILGRLLDEPADVLRFRTAAVGKPELDRDPDEHRPALRFNVSHSAELGLIAVCLGREVGVDLERVRPITEAARIVSSFFSASEAAEFDAIVEEDRALAFHRGWTRKEAVLKGFGMGLAGLSARHETGFGTTGLTRRFTPATPSCRVDRWMLWEAAPRPGFVAALVIDTGQPAASGSLPAQPASP